MSRIRRLGLSYEAADAVTLLVMQDQLKLLKRSVKDHLKKGEYMHPDDLVQNQTVLIPALKVLVHYFGG